MIDPEVGKLYYFQWAKGTRETVGMMLSFDCRVNRLKREYPYTKTSLTFTSFDLEVVASTYNSPRKQDFAVSVCVADTIREVPVTDLPLYIGFPYRYALYEELMKGR